MLTRTPTTDLPIITEQGAFGKGRWAWKAWRKGTEHDNDCLTGLGATVEDAVENLIEEEQNAPAPYNPYEDPYWEGPSRRRW